MRRMKAGPRSLLGSAGLVIAILTAPGWAEVLPPQITADTTLTQANSPYEMQSDVLVAAGARLTIQSGVTVIARGDYRLTISGSLHAAAAPGERITFQATDSHASGAWLGLYFTSGAVGRLRGCTIRSAQDNLLADSADVHLIACSVRLASRDGVMVWGDSYLRAIRCTFQNNARYGLHVQTSRPTGVISFSEFVGNGEYPVCIKATCAEMLHGANLYQSNGADVIAVDCGSATDIEDIDCWRNQFIPYDLSVASAAAELVVAEGALLKIKADTRVYPPRRIVVHGTLVLRGTPNLRTVLAPAGSPEPGDWLGIYLKPGAFGRFTSATITHAENALVLDGAGMYVRDGVIRKCQYDGIHAAGDSRVHVVHSAIKNCGRSAVRLPDPASSGNIHDCTVTGCGDYPVFAIATNAEGLRYGNSYAGNAKQAIGVACSEDPDIADDDAWLPQGVPFDLTARPDATYLHVASGARLTLRAGVQVIGGGIGAHGVLVAAGEPGKSVTFRSTSSPPTAGDWTGIEYLPGSAGRLVRATVSHAKTGVVVASDGNIRLCDSIFRFCEDDGIRLQGAAVPLITGCSVHHNGRYGIGLSDNAQPLLGVAGDAADPGQNSLFLNAEYDLRNCTPHSLRAEHNWWGTTDPAEIRAHIYDGDDDASLGQVDFEPILQTAPAALPPTVAALGLSPRPGLAIVSVSAAPTVAGAAIRVQLSRPAELRLIVRNLAGRPICHLAARAGTTAEVIIWDARNDLGTRTPAGQYLVEVHAFAGDGSISRALAPLTLRPR